MTIKEFFSGLFKKTEPEQTEISEIKEENKPDENLFCCHYCQHVFVPDTAKLFPLPVQAIGKDYHYQGIGVQCPNCLKDCIYG